MSEERLERVTRRLTPELRAHIAARLVQGAFPRPLLDGMTDAALHGVSTGAAPLESAPVPLAGLEAIVQRFGRPPLVVRNDKVELEPLPDFPEGTDIKIKAQERWTPSVGRIEFVNYQMSWGGTGWVARNDGNGALVVTNRHVAELVARRKADGRAVFMRSSTGAPYGAAIDFKEEVDSPHDSGRTAEVQSIEYLADIRDADVALLRIKTADFALPTPFELFTGEVDKDHLVALIGYPAYDSRNNADDQARYFRDLYEVKRFAPGKIMQAPREGEQLMHDCTSLGGNSGSPLISLETGAVVGLHFSGIYGKENIAVSASTLRKLLDGERPFQVRVSAEAPPERADGRHEASHFEGRQGFSTGFLKGGGVKTPWPKLRPDLQDVLAAPSDNPPEPGELRYTHFGVKYSAKHKLPLLTAVNIDGGRSVRVKRGDDQWFSDGRLSPEIQLGAANFKDAEIDRGHMVRREDPNWGAPDDAAARGAEALQANSDTFHYVNAAAQHSALNQGKTLWQGLENYILDNARTHGFQACVFTGPVLRDDDDPVDEIVIDGAIAPAEFWKLVATLDESGEKLHATAYLLSQGQLLKKLLEKRGRREGLEGFVLGAYRTFQLAIKDLAEATGYDFSAYVDADPLARGRVANEAAEAGEPLALQLETLEDVRL